MSVELRATLRDEGMVLDGTVIKYNTPYQVHDMFGSFTEVMAPGVARDVLGGDTRFLFNDDGLPLARTTNGTLRLGTPRPGCTSARRWTPPTRSPETYSRRSSAPTFLR